MSLHEVLKIKTKEWRKSNYQSEFPAIKEILNFAFNNFKENDSRSLKYLRTPQFEALEIYWYLRVKEKTPLIFDLYKKYFQNEELLDVLNIKLTSEDLKKIIFSNDGGINTIFNKIKTDNNFVKKYHLDGLRESLFLNYPSYILALAMGTGKTVLIGTIIATEFAMALEYPDKPFVKNALVFAPGKTILGALKEISDIPYEEILPSRLYKQFISTVKITYTRDGEKDIPIIKGSNFNIIVTNTEKIRIQKQSINKSLLKGLFAGNQDEAKEIVANQRLQTIASLPNLAIFSDEAHHTYGQVLEKQLKRVRQTVNYLADNTNVLAVINTTGTPYFKRQILKDVIYWYGLSQGIKDGILKEVRGNIVSYENVSDKQFLEDVVSDFLKNYKDVKIYDGNLAKLAIYFPQIEHLNSAKALIEKSVIKQGLDPSIVLPVHNESPEEIKDLFDNRINDPNLPYRIFLLVNKGTEGWNCPSLFATALARKLKSSNNFVLQAASRCLRQIPGNKYKAKIYLSKDNVFILDSQLKETYGESLEDLNTTSQEFVRERAKLRKINIPPIVLKKKVQKVVPINTKFNPQIQIQKPIVKEKDQIKEILTLDDFNPKKVLITIDQEKIKTEPDYIDIYSLAVEISCLYRLPLMNIYEQLKNLYPKGEISELESLEIKKQIEDKIKNYKVITEVLEQALALVKKEGFKEERENNQSIYVTEIIFHKDRADKLLLSYEQVLQRLKQKELPFGFHYSPYNFDSDPEKEFFENILRELMIDKDDVEDIYFTGAIDDPNKTDFFFEYKDTDGKWHNYTPDFLIRKKNGKMLIVEIKGKPFRDKQKEKEMHQIENLNPDRLKYEILETTREELAFNEVDKVKKWIYGQ
ncbi:MAG TPA: DEAD/DEAH box helicase family protein [Candidatus Pacearchaeota archaeon]|nr:DEAD/DEAH box helicase family protein [Candidatus Pacearchaeota archaeon]